MQVKKSTLTPKQLIQIKSCLLESNEDEPHEEVKQLSEEFPGCYHLYKWLENLKNAHDNLSITLKIADDEVEEILSNKSSRYLMCAHGYDN